MQTTGFVAVEGGVGRPAGARQQGGGLPGGDLIEALGAPVGGDHRPGFIEPGQRGVQRLATTPQGLVIAEHLVLDRLDGGPFVHRRDGAGRAQTRAASGRGPIAGAAPPALGQLRAGGSGDLARGQGPSRVGRASAAAGPDHQFAGRRVAGGEQAAHRGLAVVIDDAQPARAADGAFAEQLHLETLFK